MTECRELTPFRRALLDSVLTEYADIPDEHVEAPFSDRFLEKMDGILQPSKGVLTFRTRRVIRAILIAAILIALLAGSVMAIPGMQQWFTGIIFTRGEDWIEITVDQELAARSPQTIETIYELGYIPEGFTVELNSLRKHNKHYSWSNSDSELLCFDQHVIRREDSSGGINITFGDEDDPIETRKMGNYDVNIVHNRYGKKYIWIGEGYWFYLDMPSSLDEATMEKIFYSVRPAAP